jgi:hypothetical protein
VRDRTASLWTYINADLAQFRNPQYRAMGGLQECRAIFPSPHARCLKLWESWFFRWDRYRCLISNGSF